MSHLSDAGLVLARFLFLTGACRLVDQRLDLLSREELEAEVSRWRAQSNQADVSGLVFGGQKQLSDQIQRLGGFGYFSCDLGQGVVHGTRAFFELCGMPPADTCPVASLESLSAAERFDLTAVVIEKMQGDCTSEFDICFRRADGLDTRWVRYGGKVELDLGGRPHRFSGVARDVTPELEAHRARAASDARYQALFEALDDGFCIIEFFDGPHGPKSDYVHVEANSGYERQTGIQGIVGQTVRELAPLEADGWVDIYRRVLETGEPLRFERYFQKVKRDIEVSAARIEPASRQQVSVLFRDISGRKKAETLAKANIERVQLALAAGAIIGTWVWDLKGDRFTVDEAFARAFGLDPELGHDGIPLAKIIETVHPNDKPGLVAAIEEAIHRGGPYAHQYRTLREDGRYYWLEANGHVTHGPGGEPLNFPGVLINIEERRAVEAERDSAASALRALTDTLELRVAERTEALIRSEEKLRQSQKMEAVGQLTGGLAHDFNNLLSGILGSLDMIAARVSQGRFTELSKYMGAAQSAAKRAAALTHRLLAFSRRQTLDPKTIDVNELIDGMCELIQRTVGPSVQISVKPASDLWLVKVDPSQLENSLLNLCINARDAMPRGGDIVIETANISIPESAGTGDQELQPGQYLILSVTDNGAGMAADVAAKAFEPFFTTKPIGQGTGLGLSMIYGFANQSSGEVRIKSTEGQGTTVSIYLPRFDGALDVTRDIEPSDPPIAPVDGGVVLIVEDEATVRLLVTDVLQELGYTAIEATDSIGGLRILQSNTRVDLLISDVGLPGGINGRQMADAGRLVRPDLKVLFITGYAESALLNEGELGAGMSILTKPFAIESLCSKVRELLTN